MAEALNDNLKLLGLCLCPGFLEAADIVAASPTPASTCTRAAPCVTQVEVALDQPQRISNRFQ